MADFRNVHTHMWVSDEWFAELDGLAKLLWIYLFTNQTASVAGIYRLPLRVICFGTGLEPEQVRRYMADFERAGKIMWDGEVVWVKKMRSYQTQGNPVSIAKCIERDLARIPDGPLKLAYQAYQSGKPLPPSCTQDGTTVPPALVRDETNPTPNPNPTPRRAPNSPPPPAQEEPKHEGNGHDEEFGKLWAMLTKERIVVGMSDVLRDDVAELWQDCPKLPVWVQGVTRAKARDPSAANWALVKRIMADYIRYGTFDRPGGNHGTADTTRRGRRASPSDSEWEALAKQYNGQPGPSPGVVSPV